MLLKHRFNGAFQVLLLINLISEVTYSKENGFLDSPVSVRPLRIFIEIIGAKLEKFVKIVRSLILFIRLVGAQINQQINDGIFGGQQGLSEILLPPDILYWVILVKLNVSLRE